MFLDEIQLDKIHLRYFRNGSNKQKQDIIKWAEDTRKLNNTKVIL